MRLRSKKVVPRDLPASSWKKAPLCQYFCRKRHLAFCGLLESSCTTKKPTYVNTTKGAIGVLMAALVLSRIAVVNIQLLCNKPMHKKYVRIDDPL